MHVADIEKTIKGYIWTCLPSMFQDICLADPENSERGDRDTCQLLRPLGPTPKSAHALLLFRQSRFRWQVVLNQETKCRTHSPERVAYTAPPPPPSTPRDGDDQPRPQGFSVKMGGGAVGTRLGDDQSIEERRLVISEVNKKKWGLI